MNLQLSHISQSINTDWGVCSWPWQLLARRKDRLPLLVTSNRRVPVKILVRSAGVF
jgi:hypothetical protein